MKEKLNEELKALLAKYKPETKSNEDKEYLNSLYYLMRVSEQDEVVEVIHEFLHEVHDQFSALEGEIIKEEITSILEATLVAHGWADGDGEDINEMVYGKRRKNESRSRCLY